MVHRKRVKHLHEPGHLHEFTFSCYGRMPLLVDHELLEPLARKIDAKAQGTYHLQETINGWE